MNTRTPEYNHAADVEAHWRSGRMMPADVRTDFDPAPIPFRGADWTAWKDGREDSGPIGRGRTESDAIDDLLDQLGES